MSRSSCDCCGGKTEQLVPLENVFQRTFLEYDMTSNGKICQLCLMHMTKGVTVLGTENQQRTPEQATIVTRDGTVHYICPKFCVWPEDNARVLLNSPNVETGDVFPVALDFVEAYEAYE